tara:strand:- start:65 stop:661 length:597 start_codon:yes stop_codon:yes gene_type:complete
MIETIFPNNFYSVVSAPNKDEVITTFTNALENKEQTKELLWPNACEIKVESLSPNGVGPVLAPTLSIFFRDLGVDQGDKDLSRMRMLSIWRNTYNKGYYQEIHDHLSAEGSDLSGVVFLNDYEEGSSQFYFYNKHWSEIPQSWMMIIDKVKADNAAKFTIPNPKAGDVLLFPSYVPHGVTMHKIDQPRTTVSFNIAFK